LSYLKAVKAWIRLPVVSLLLFMTAAGTAAADGQTGLPTGTESAATSSSTAAGTTTQPSATANAVTPPVSSTTVTSAPAATANTSLSALNLAPHAFGSRMLKVGSQGTDVVALQHDLTALGFTTGANGTFTHQTYSQLRTFQRRYHLTVDGVAGPTSIAKLKRLLSSSLHIAETANGVTAAATSSTSSAPLPTADTGGVGVVPLAPTTDTTVQDATMIDGLAIPAAGTPEVVQEVLAAANKIAFDPYIYGGGHASFTAAGYDCSGSVSFALHGGGLLATPLDSEQFLQYGEAGVGNWITIYTNGPTHAYMEIAGIWFDTAAQSATNGMDRWSLTRINEPPQYYGKFVPRHPAGW
jgi:peptidoglycan hydrolase-like protein with peptidoglycan-binding domain